jgi:hypothetical protein
MRARARPIEHGSNLNVSVVSGESSVRLHVQWWGLLHAPKAPAWSLCMYNGLLCCMQQYKPLYMQRPGRLPEQAGSLRRTQPGDLEFSRANAEK